MTIKFTKDHEWIRVEGDTGTVGISDYAQDSLGDIVFVEIPEMDATLKKGDEVAVVESVKAASEVYTPVSGKVTDVNEELSSDPGLVNASPLNKGWFFKIKIADPKELDDLLTEAEYNDYLETIS